MLCKSDHLNVFDFISLKNNLIFRTARKTLLSINYKITINPYNGCNVSRELLNIAWHIIEFHGFHSSPTIAFIQPLMEPNILAKKPRKLEFVLFPENFGICWFHSLEKMSKFNIS